MAKGFSDSATNVLSAFCLAHHSCIDNEGKKRKNNFVRNVIKRWSFGDWLWKLVVNYLKRGSLGESELKKSQRGHASPLPIFTSKCPPPKKIQIHGTNGFTWLANYGVLHAHFNPNGLEAWGEDCRKTRILTKTWSTSTLKEDKD